MKYRKRPVIVEAEQWFKFGDLPSIVVGLDSMRPMRECKQCGNRMGQHGWVDTLEGGHIVCPGDYIITGVEGEHYPVKPGIFEKTYEEIGHIVCPGDYIITGVEGEHYPVKPGTFEKTYEEIGGGDGPPTK